jgi:uncharacterized protein
MENNYQMAIDILLAVLGLGLIVLGILGCVLPIIPGPPISFLGLLVLHFGERFQFQPSFLWWMALLALFVTVMDYIVPVWGTKKFGGSKRGIWGATLGLLVGLFLGPIGIIVGPFAGAVLAEASAGRKQHEAIKAGLGAFIGFLLGIGMKLVASGLMTFYFFKEAIKGFF